MYKRNILASGISGYNRVLYFQSAYNNSWHKKVEKQAFYNFSNCLDVICLEPE